MSEQSPPAQLEGPVLKTLTKTQVFAIKRAQQEHNAAILAMQQTGQQLREILEDCGIDPNVPVQVHDDGTVRLPASLPRPFPSPGNRAARRAASRNGTEPPAAE